MSSTIDPVDPPTRLSPLQVDVDECNVNEENSPRTNSNSVSPQEWSEPSRSLYERLFGQSEPPVGACADGNGTTANISEPATPVVGNFSSLWVSSVHQKTIPTSRHLQSSTVYSSPGEDWSAFSSDPDISLPMYLRDRGELTPGKLAEIRAKDAERKRRWRHKRRLENSISNSEASSIALLRIETHNSKNGFIISPIPSEPISESPSSTPNSDEKRHVSRRATLSPDRLKAIRAKDAERKRRARLRKRMQCDVMPRHQETEIDAHTTDFKVQSDSSVLHIRGVVKTVNDEVVTNAADVSQNVPDLHISNCANVPLQDLEESSEPLETRSNESEQTVDNLISPRSDGKSHRLPRKALPPELLQEVRAKDNARKREQRARKKQAKQFEMASTLLQMMTGNESNLLLQTAHSNLRPSLLSPPLNTLLSPMSVLSPSTYSLPTSLPLNIILPTMNPYVANIQPSLAASLRIDVSSSLSPCVGGSAPASLTSVSSLPSIQSLTQSSDTTAFDLLKNLVQHAHTSPRSFDERAAAKRAARAARIAKMSEEEKKHLRVMDRERKRAWRQKRKQEMSGFVTCTVTPTSELSKEFIAQISPHGPLGETEVNEESV